MHLPGAAERTGRCPSFKLTALAPIDEKKQVLEKSESTL